LEALGFLLLLLCLKETALGKWVGGEGGEVGVFCHQILWKAKSCQAFKKGFRIAIIYLFVVFGLFSKSWILFIGNVI
jgi:hypothetical protein